MKHISVFLLALLLCVASDAQNPFIKHYGDAAVEMGAALAEIPGGGYLLTGSSQPGAVVPTMHFVQTDANGDTLNIRDYHNTGFQPATRIVPISGGRFAVCGSNVLPGAQFRAACLAFVNPGGDTLQTKTFNFLPVQSWAKDLVQTSDGGFLIACGADGAGMQDTDAWFIRTDSLGDTLWTRLISTALNEEPAAAIETADGGFAFTGIKQDAGPNAADMYLGKFDGNGILLWEKQFGGPEFDFGMDLVETADSGFAVCGVLGTPGFNTFGEAYLVKTDSAGDTLWTRRGLPTLTAFNSIVEEPDGELVLCGDRRNSDGPTDITPGIMRYDASGTQLFAYNFFINGTGVANEIIRNNAGTWSIVGTFWDFGADDGNFMLILTDSVGVAYVGKEESLPELEMVVFPNPFTDQIRLGIPGAKALVSLEFELYTMDGRKVLTETLGTAGEYHLDLSFLQSGIYSFRLLGEGRLLNSGRLIRN